MSGITLDEDPIDEVLYLARANEASELERYLTELSAQTKHGKAELVAAAVDPYSKNSALHYAAANGHTDLIKSLLSYSQGDATRAIPVLLNSVNDAGNSPLHWAALNGQLACVKLLVESGADVTIINKAGHDAVFEAEINDKKDVVDWLLGAVEELEKGIGEDGEPSQPSGNHEMEVDDGADASGVNGATEGSAGETGVENVREQLENLETRDGTSQGG